METEGTIQISVTVSLKTGTVHEPVIIVPEVYYQRTNNKLQRNISNYVMEGYIKGLAKEAVTVTARSIVEKLEDETFSVASCETEEHNDLDELKIDKSTESHCSVGSRKFRNFQRKQVTKIWKWRLREGPKNQRLALVLGKGRLSLPSLLIVNR